MLKQAASLLVRLGLIMLVLALLARFSGLSGANLVGDDLAILVSLAVVIAGASYTRFGAD